MMKQVRIDSETVIQVDSSIPDDVAYHEYWDKLEGSKKSMQIKADKKARDEKILDDSIDKTKKELKIYPYD